MKKLIAILGSTGSIGTQALQVIEEHPDKYEAYVLTANNRVEELIAQARKFKPEAVVIANEAKYQQLKDALADLPVKVYAGEEALCQIVQEKPIDIVLTAMVGYAGLRPTINAIRARKAIALARRTHQSTGTRKPHPHPASRLGTFCHLPMPGRRSRQRY